MHIVVALEPRYYREVIGAAIKGAKPHVEVKVVEPVGLEELVRHLGPALVICERPSSWMTPHSSSEPLPSWIEYRPYEESATRVSLGGRYRELEAFELEDLLSVVDEADELSRARRPPTDS